MDTDMRAALWLMPRPDTPLFEALEQTISGLAPLFDDAPRFAPHVTLTTGIQAGGARAAAAVLDRAAAAARAVPHVDVVLQALAYGAHFFRKVALDVRPDAELVSLATVCREMFVLYPALLARTPNFAALSEPDRAALRARVTAEAEAWGRDEFRPHLSLAYSNIYTVTEAMRATIDGRLRDVFGPRYASRGIGWTGGRLALVLVEGHVEEWKVLGYRDI